MVRMVDAMKRTAAWIAPHGLVRHHLNQLRRREEAVQRERAKQRYAVIASGGDQRSDIVVT